MTAPAVALHRALGLTDEELVAIEARLGRSPNDLELAMFSVMWSEHCSYKSSRPLLATLPTGGDDVVAGPGENAGVQRIGDGLAVAFKIESHNHPSAVEPYQGAATGVGGILRDIFAMGARPIAVLDALRFGDPSDERTRHLVNGVVGGVGGYGNCVGVPTVGGELVFDPSYQGNPLVNVMAIGIVREDRIMRAAAPGPGNLVVLYGSATGRDGIGGASVLASATFGDQDLSKRPAVQVGDPFAEKLLIEATLEIIERGLAEGIQDLGAAGITCGVAETADRAGTGILVDLDAIPRREPGMAPFEVLISESQERMIAIVRPDRQPEIAAVCRRWGIPCAVIGRVTADGDITVVEGGLDADGRPNAGARELARVAARALASEAIVFERLAAPPARHRAAPSPGLPPAPSELLPERGMDPGRRPPGPPRQPEPLVPPLRLRAVRPARRDEHRGRPRPRRRGPPDQGDAAGTRGDDRLRPGRRRAGPVPRRRDVGGRGDPQRERHRGPAPGRHELPQLRRPHPARGVLGAPGGRPRPRRRLPGPWRPGHGRQCLALQRGARQRDCPDAGDRGRGACRRRGRARGPGLPCRRGGRPPGGGRRHRASAAPPMPPWPGEGTTTRPRWTCSARWPSRRSCEMASRPAS